jgi:hypothetical protein
MQQLKENDPIRIVGNEFQTSLGLVKEGTIGRVLGFLHEDPVRVHVEIYGPEVRLYILEQFVEYHRPPDDEYR